jgi:hypothetical protein
MLKITVGTVMANINDVNNLHKFSKNPGTTSIFWVPKGYMKQFLTDNPQTLGRMVQKLIPQDLCTHDVRSSLSKSRLT